MTAPTRAPRCPRCARGRMFRDETRVVCLACGHATEDRTTLLERVLSNVTPEADTDSGRREPGDIAAALDRAMERPA